MVEGVFFSSGCGCETILDGGGCSGVGGWRLGGMRWVSSAAVSTIFGPGKTWDGGIVASFGAVGTLVTWSTVGTVVPLGTATRVCWRKRAALGWGVEGGRGTGGCDLSGWRWMVAR